jgi:hypothetical protein
MTVTTAFFFIYFSGKWPLMVAGTVPVWVSRGLGVTVKLSAESGPSLEHEERSIRDAADKRRKFFFCILKEVL